MQENLNKNDMNSNDNIESTPKKDSGSRNGMFWTVFVVVILVIVGVWIWAPTGEAPTGEAPTLDETATTTENESEAGQDSTEDIQSQLEGINIDDLEGEFKSIDQDLQDLEG